MSNEDERLVPRYRAKIGYAAPSVGDLLNTTSKHDSRVDMEAGSAASTTNMHRVFKVRALLRNGLKVSNPAEMIFTGMNTADVAAAVLRLSADSLRQDAPESCVDLLLITDMSEEANDRSQVWQLIITSPRSWMQQSRVGPDGVEALIQEGIISRAEMFPAFQGGEAATPHDDVENPYSYCGEDWDKNTVYSHVNYEKTLSQMQRQLQGWLTQQPLSMSLEQCNRLRAALAALSWVYGAFAVNRTN